MKGRMMTTAKAIKFMDRPIIRSAKTIAKAVECFRMASEEKKRDCPNHSCPYNNDCAEYGYWCCANSILFDAARKLIKQEEKIKSLEKKIDKMWTGE